MLLYRSITSLWRNDGSVFFTTLLQFVKVFFSHFCAALLSFCDSISVKLRSGLWLSQFQENDSAVFQPSWCKFAERFMIDFITARSPCHVVTKQPRTITPPPPCLMLCLVIKPLWHHVITGYCSWLVVSSDAVLWTLVLFPRSFFEQRCQTNF